MICRSRYCIFIIIYIYNLAFLLILFPTGIQTSIGESTKKRKEKANRQNPFQKASKMQKFNSYWTLYQLISGSVVRSLFVRFAAMCCCLSKSIGHHGYVVLRGLTGPIFSFISQLQVAIRLQQHHYTPFADRT